MTNLSRICKNSLSISAPPEINRGVHSAVVCVCVYVCYCKPPAAARKENTIIRQVRRERQAAHMFTLHAQGSCSSCADPLIHLPESSRVVDLIQAGPRECKTRRGFIDLASQVNYLFKIQSPHGANRCCSKHVSKQ